MIEQMIEPADSPHHDNEREEARPVGFLPPEGEIGLLPEEAKARGGAWILHHPHEKTGRHDHEGIGSKRYPGDPGPAQLRKLRADGAGESHDQPPVSRMKCRSRSSASGTSRRREIPAPTRTRAMGRLPRFGRKRGESRLPNDAQSTRPSFVPQHPLGFRDVVDVDLDRQPAVLPQVAVVHFLDQGAVVHDPHAVGEVLHLVQEVARHEDGHALLVGQSAQERPDLHDACRVKAVGRLVQDQKLRLVNQRPGKRQSLLVAQREPPRPSMLVFSQAEKVDDLVDGRRRESRSGAAGCAGSPSR